jgi:hypothetical protein
MAGNGQISAKVSFFRNEPNSLDLLALRLDGCNQPVSDDQPRRIQIFKIEQNPSKSMSFCWW